MTEQDIADLGPAFAGYLARFRRCFGQKRTAAHFDTYCRGLLSDLPRKSVEPIALADRPHTLIVAINEATAEVKYFLTNATAEPLDRVLAVAFRRATVEHAFRLGKQEAGLMDYEGRDYTGLTRHLVLALVVLGFVAVHTERLRGGKPARHGRAGVPGAEHPVRDGVP